LSYLASIEVIGKKRIGTDADVEGSQPHVHTEQEEIPMVPMPHTVVKPSFAELRNSRQ
jgi:hypothetical protein